MYKVLRQYPLGFSDPLCSSQPEVKEIYSPKDMILSPGDTP